MDKLIKECDLIKDHSEKHDESRRGKTYIFSDASNQPCCTAATVVVEHSLAVVKGLPDIVIKDLQTRRLNSKIRVNQWSNGGTPSEEYP